MTETPRRRRRVRSTHENPDGTSTRDNPEVTGIAAATDAPATDRSSDSTGVTAAGGSNGTVDAAPDNAVPDNAVPVRAVLNNAVPADAVAVGAGPDDAAVGAPVPDGEPDDTLAVAHTAAVIDEPWLVTGPVEPEALPAERGLRGLVGGGSSQVSPLAAMRARDAARPRPEDLERSAAGLAIVRRNWSPRE